MVSVHVELLDTELWDKFSSATNEMIVTKSGRRMFPVVKIKVTGLMPKSFYRIKLEYVQIGITRWKYMSGSWQPSGKAEGFTSQCIYQHPDSPNLGSFWMEKDEIQFSKVKLTNKPNSSAEQVVLNSLHKYQPVVIVELLDQGSEPCHSYKFEFPEAEFIAVTAYQNEAVTKLKIKYNPFAKAFQETHNRSTDFNGYRANSSLANITNLSPNLNSLNITSTSNSNNINLLGSSGSNSSLVIPSTTSSNLLNYNSSPNNSLTNSSPNSNNSPSNLVSTTSPYSSGLCNPNNPYAVQNYLSAAVPYTRSTPTPFSVNTMNSYYNNNNTYQDLSNCYHPHLAVPDQMVYLNNNSPSNYNNLNLNNPVNQLSHNNNLNCNNVVSSSQFTSLSDETILPTSTLNNSISNINNGNITVKSPGSPTTTDLSQTNNQISLSCSPSSSHSSHPYCERFSSIKNHRLNPYPTNKSTSSAANFSYSWSQQSYNTIL